MTIFERAFRYCRDRSTDEKRGFDQKDILINCEGMAKQETLHKITQIRT